jgi:hypothetical protein
MPYALAQLPPNRDIDPWVAQIQGLNLRARRHVLRRFTPPMSPFLYKYFPNHGDYWLINLRDVLVGSVLRLSTPTDFNDPFEMAAHFVMRATDEQKLERYEALVRAQMPHLGSRARQARVDALMTTPIEQLRPVWEQSLARMRHASGIYCFAGDLINRLMWGHYASNHKGVCLEFERVRDTRVLSHAFRVDYVKDLPEIDWVVDLHRGITRMLFSKDPCWSYEQESRIMISDQAERYLAFEPGALRRLVFGCKSEPDLIERVEGLLAERAADGLPPVRIYHARQHPTKYRLMVTRLAH